MEAKKTLLTYTGLKKLEDELENLKVVKRKEVAGKIKEAREQGDLSENAEAGKMRRNGICGKAHRRRRPQAPDHGYGHYQGNRDLRAQGGAVRRSG